LQKSGATLLNERHMRPKREPAYIDRKCKNFALKSSCTLLDSIYNSTTFLETYSDKFCIILSIVVDLFPATIAGCPFVWTTYEVETNLPIESKCKNFFIEIALYTARFNWKFDNFAGKIQNWVLIIFFVYYYRFVFCNDRGLHFYMNDIRDRNVNLHIDNKYRNFALKSSCTLLDSIENSITFRETHSDEFYIIFFVYYGRFIFCKYHGLHFCMNDIWDRNVNLPIDSEVKKFPSESCCTLVDSIENLTTFRESWIEQCAARF